MDMCLNSDPYDLRARAWVHHASCSWRRFYKDAAVTAATLQEKLGAESKIDAAQAAALIQECGAIFEHAASNAMGSKAFSEYLAFTHSIPEKQRSVWTGVWEQHAAAAHAALVAGTVWNSTLEGVSWRLDMLSAGGSGKGPEGDEVLDPVALVQMNVRYVARATGDRRDCDDVVTAWQQLVLPLPCAAS